MPTQAPYRLLLLEDDFGITQLIKDVVTDRNERQRFDRNEYIIDTFNNSADAFAHVQTHGLPHLALVDLQLPPSRGFEVENNELAGFAFCERLRQMGDVPVIFVTANSEVDVIIEALVKYKGEDFITKAKFDAQELLARIHVVLRRKPSFDYTNKPVVVVDELLSIDFSRSQIILRDTIHQLTPTEIQLLSILLKNAGRVVENRILLARVWSDQQTVAEDTLRVHMHRLRRKLESNVRQPTYIRTERGTGYMFTVRPSDEAGNGGALADHAR